MSTNRETLSLASPDSIAEWVPATAVEVVVLTVTLLSVDDDDGSSLFGTINIDCLWNWLMKMMDRIKPLTKEAAITATPLGLGGCAIASMSDY